MKFFAGGAEVGGLRFARRSFLSVKLDEETVREVLAKIVAKDSVGEFVGGGYDEDGGAKKTRTLGRELRSQLFAEFEKLLSGSALGFFDTAVVEDENFDEEIDFDFVQGAVPHPGLEQIPKGDAEVLESLKQHLALSELLGVGGGSGDDGGPPRGSNLLRPWLEKLVEGAEDLLFPVADPRGPHEDREITRALDLGELALGNDLAAAMAAPSDATIPVVGTRYKSFVVGKSGVSVGLDNVRSVAQLVVGTSKNEEGAAARRPPPSAGPASTVLAKLLGARLAGLVRTYTLLRRLDENMGELVAQLRQGVADPETARPREEDCLFQENKECSLEDLVLAAKKLPLGAADYDAFVDAVAVGMKQAAVGKKDAQDVFTRLGFSIDVVSYIYPKVFPTRPFAPPETRTRSTAEQQGAGFVVPPVRAFRHPDAPGGGFNRFWLTPLDREVYRKLAGTTTTATAQRGEGGRNLLTVKAGRVEGGDFLVVAEEDPAMMVRTHALEADEEGSSDAEGDVDPNSPAARWAVNFTDNLPIVAEQWPEFLRVQQIYKALMLFSEYLVKPEVVGLPFILANFDVEGRSGLLEGRSRGTGTGGEGGEVPVPSSSQNQQYKAVPEKLALLDKLKKLLPGAEKEHTLGRKKKSPKKAVYTNAFALVPSSQYEFTTHDGATKKTETTYGGVDLPIGCGLVSSIDISNADSRYWRSHHSSLGRLSFADCLRMESSPHDSGMQALKSLMDGPGGLSFASTWDLEKASDALGKLSSADFMTRYRIEDELKSRNEQKWSLFDSGSSSSLYGVSSSSSLSSLYGSTSYDPFGLNSSSLSLGLNISPSPSLSVNFNTPAFGLGANVGLLGAGTGWLIGNGDAGFKSVSDQCQVSVIVGSAQSMSQCLLPCTVHVTMSCQMHSHVDGCTDEVPSRISTVSFRMHHSLARNSNS